MSPFERERRSRGLTLEQLAAKLGTTHATIQRWEKGKASPSPRFVPLIARVFRMSAKGVTHLFDPQPAEPVAA